jgi:hypothetical protein
MESVMARDHRFLSKCLLYVAVVGLSLTGIALGLTGVALTGVGLTSIASRTSIVTSPKTALSQPEQTVLDLRMQSLREVRQALAKPLPSVEPLPRITGLATHMAKNSRDSVASQSRRLKLMDEARNAFATIEPSAPVAQSSAYTEIDRHAVH